MLVLLVNATTSQGDHGEQVQEEGVQVWVESVSPTCTFPKLLYLNHSRNCMFPWGRVLLGMSELVEELEGTLGQTKSSKQLLYCSVGVMSPSCTYPRSLHTDTTFAGTWSEIQMWKVSGLGCSLQQLLVKLVSKHFVLKIRSTLINIPFKNAVIKIKKKKGK